MSPWINPVLKNLIRKRHWPTKGHMAPREALKENADLWAAPIVDSQKKINTIKSKPR